MNQILSLEECDAILENRRRHGDLHPDRIREEQEKFSESLRWLK
jgi:hypothetical protein